MLPTIASSGDWLLISKYYRRGRQLSVGDVVSFKHPINVGEYAVKRIVGMPGDFVVVTGLTGKGKGEDGRMLQVPTGHCWVVGDNMAWSRDSRVFGPLPLALVTGKVVRRLTFGDGWRVVRRVENGLQAAGVEDDVD